MKFLTISIIIFFCIAALPKLVTESKQSVNKEIGELKLVKVDFINADAEFYKKKLYGNLGYNEVFSRMDVKNLSLAGKESIFGVWGKNENEKIIGVLMRGLRFQNITQAVEKKYGLPQNLLLAMVMHESAGIEYLPNARDDGGLGLCHMQPSIATMFGLKTLDNCDKLVSKEHGKKLRRLIERHKNEPDKLISFDDRFHPIITLDATARILKNYMTRPSTRKPVELAIFLYGGGEKFPVYYGSVKKYWNAINDSTKIEEVRKCFNQINPDLVIGGKKADFDSYIDYYQHLNYNFGLEEYEKELYLPENEFIIEDNE